MRNVSKFFSAISLSAMMTLTSLGPAAAMPLPTVSPPQIGNVEQVQYRHHDRRRYYRHHRGDRHYSRHHRRYDRHHHRHRRSNAGAIIGGLAAGAIIGGAIANSGNRSYGNSHAQWCANRYRTYRASDNSYVPRAGVRAQCRSPY
ncbi:BA14K family protein [Rhizobium wenxiniae]|nr:BA14K family protein [Rhizobium wenxiniae]